MWQRIAYVAACILVPLAWGILSAVVSRYIDEHRPRPKPAEPRLPDIDYHI